MSNASPPHRTPERTGPRSRGILVKLSLAALVFLACLGLGEVALRWSWSARGRPFTAETALAEIRKAGTLLQEGVDRGDQAPDQGAPDARHTRPGREKARQFLHPYFGWDVEGPSLEYVEQLELFRQQGADKAFDVLVLGGSVAAGFGWTGRKALFEELSADPRLEGRPLRMFNHGIAGYKQPQQVNRLAYLLTLGYAPDLVINLDGFNELALGLTNSVTGIHPVHPSGGHWSRLMVGAESSSKLSGPTFDALAELRWHQLHAEASVRRAEELGLQRWALTTELAVGWIRRIRRAGFAAYDRFVAAGSEEELALPIYGPEFDSKTPRALELLVESWANASLAMSGMCRERGIAYVHVLQPTLHDKGSKPLTQEELDSSACSVSWRQGAELGYPMLRRAGKELRAAGVDFLDASMIFADVHETLYFDACHYVREGQEMLARAIVREYLEQLPPEGPAVPTRSFRTKFFQGQD